MKFAVMCAAAKMPKMVVFSMLDRSIYSRHLWGGIYPPPKKKKKKIRLQPYNNSNTKSVKYGKIIKIAVFRCVSYAQNMPEMRLRPGLSPGPRWGSLQRSPRPPSGI